MTKNVWSAKCRNQAPKISKIIGVSFWSPSSLDLYSLDYTIWGVLESKTNTTSYSNIGSLKTAIEEEWNKMSEEFILKACKSFRRPVDTMSKKKNKNKTKNKTKKKQNKKNKTKKQNKIKTAILSKFFCFVSILFCCLFKKIRINLVL